MSKPKPRSRSVRIKPAAKRRRVSSPDSPREDVLPYSCTGTSDTTVAGDKDVTAGFGLCTGPACQRDEVVCSFSEFQAVKGQHRSATQQFRRCQMKMAKMTVSANRRKRLDQDVQKLSDREKFIFDQWLMKANAKSPTAVSYPKARKFFIVTIQQSTKRSRLGFARGPS
ncbi:hypothetical protein HPB50_020309 [Hyalomma asiaticum]|uniref:Uncharacterized protein n=1 Tax=Hyalomma asiaticum TaxID=266040 RepID=A0ACB7RM81_HYAAI|nr:hypothetical protein HPB50_020309 [Hyalomma asiaticum]